MKLGGPLVLALLFSSPALAEWECFPVRQFPVHIHFAHHHLGAAHHVHKHRHLPRCHRLHLRCVWVADDLGGPAGGSPYTGEFYETAAIDLGDGFFGGSGEFGGAGGGGFDNGRKPDRNTVPPMITWSPPYAPPYASPPYDCMPPWTSTPVPEISTWAMTLTGFLGLGYAAFRKGKST